MATHQSDPTKGYQTSTTDKAKDAAEGTIDQVKHKAGEYADRAQEQAKRAAESRKDHAAENLGTVAEAFRETGNRLRGQENMAMADTIAQYTDKLADQVDRFSRQLREKDINDLIGDVENMARQRPAIFLGGMFAAGILLARFLKSSGSRAEMRQTYTNYGTQRYGAAYGTQRSITRRPTEISGYAPTVTGREMDEDEIPQVTETSEERHLGRRGLEYEG